MSVSNKNKNRGAHGDSSFMLGGLPSSSENPPAFAVVECHECGLSEDMNIALGYSGQIEFRAKKPEEERGCPPDYNPGFCYGDEDCEACWEGWRKEQEG